MNSASIANPSSRRRMTATAVLLLSLAIATGASSPAGAQNPIVLENQNTGVPASVWDVSGAGDRSIQGFATDISVNRGETVRFKIKTDAAAYHIDIYRLGYYQGLGARLMGAGVVTASLPQSQPADLYDAATGLTDCGNWAESAHWDVPPDAVSGIYLAKLTRDDTDGASHIVFVVRDDARASDLFFKTSDATWQAYNVYGGNSLYVGTTSFPSGHAAKVSYNRPFYTRDGGGGGGAAEDWLFNAEYPMVRWLEANGYDVTYTTDVDADRHAARLLDHDVILSVGHDEYWSAAERAAFEAARAAGRHLAFFSGNEIYWKTRWETSIDGSGTPHRTLVCYKEGTLGENACGEKCDPLSDTWTGLWRDGCAFTPPADGCAPENALSGQISWDGTTGTLQVPAAYSNLRFWRNTSVATLGPGQTATLTPGTLGYEWDWEQYGEHYPPGRILLSTTLQNGRTHHLSLYRHPSGSLVFGAGTVQWSWGLDSHHDRGSDSPSLDMQQATVNLFADMGVQPATLQAGLVAASASADLARPVSVITSPLHGGSTPSGTTVSVSGTASDAGGVLVGVEVSTDGGSTWRKAAGTTAWTYAWTPTAEGTVTVQSRGYDDSGNMETPGAAPASNAVTVTVTAPAPPDCPCAIFAPSTVPTVENANDGQGIELGVKFRVLLDGFVTGVRFYKGSQNTGTHVGQLWSGAGALLAEATFTGESASGWQQVDFTTPVPVTTGTTYIAAYHSPAGYYSFDNPGFDAQGTTNGPLHAMGNGEDGPNGVYLYGATPAFPTASFQGSNYWVDVVFDTPGGPDETPPTVTGRAPIAGATGVIPTTTVTAVFSEALDAATVATTTFELRDALDAPVPATVEYDAASRTATLTPGERLAFDGVYTATIKGGAVDPRIKDVAGNALAADVAWSFTVAGPDLVPPTVVSTSPASGAGVVATTATVEATFDEALTPATVNPATFELRDAANALVPAAVSYNIYTYTVTLTPAAPLAAFATYTATLKGGAGGIEDASGNALPADHVWSFTTGTGFDCPCTVFPAVYAPVNASVTDNRPLELGMKFRTSVNGWVTGVRFYKGALNTGTHVGHLWSVAGTQLAEATFTGETPTGWQEVTFANPVAVTANTTYIVSYHSPSYFADTSPWFEADSTRGPLIALGDGTDGPNGVYAYGEGGFPTSSYQKSNYWVDVVFNTSVGPDVTAPTVTATLPTAGASGVAISTAVIATFSEAFDAATVNGATFELRDGASALVAATVTSNPAARTATLTPAAPLAYSSPYTATLAGGTGGIADPSGNTLAADVVWTFTTAAPPAPPPTEGPGGPILVVSAAANPFSRYPVEILRAEGLNAFTAMDITLVDAGVLAAHDVVVLGEMALTGPQITMLSDWVDAGGTLVALRPDAQLAPLLGLAPAGGTLADRYLLVDTASGPGAGIVDQTIQYHGAADLYTLNGATAVATLYSDATTATPNPAVTTRSVGANGGRAIAFAYDLARSVVYTRQGNPAWVGQERDGVSPIRPDDLFFGAAAGDPQPDWIDLSKVAIPQADEQQRLLANLMILGSQHRKPLPRFWYLPKGLKAAIVETGDDHGDAGMAPRFDIYRNASDAGCSVPDWECVRGTGYLYLGTSFTDAQALFYHDLGFEVALHVNTNCQNFDRQQYTDFITSQMADFQAKYVSIPRPVTNRNHCIAWTDWSMTAEVEAESGIRLDTNYYYWPPAWVQDTPGMFTGSGMPMRFAKLDGTIIDCFQAATEMPDESGLTFPAFCDVLLSRATGPEGYYGVFTTNMHFDSQNHPGSNAIVASARAHGVPVVTARQMLDWLDGRNASTFGSLAWNGDALSFTIGVGAGANHLRAMLPMQGGGGQLSGLTLNGAPLTYATETIKGIAYATFPASAGDYLASYAADGAPPVITAVTATPHTDGTVTVTWTTDEPADSKVDYGTAPDALTSSASQAALVTSHGVTLTGLASSTAYHYRVTSKDAANNSATEPAGAPLTFTTAAPVCFQDRTAADFALGTTGAATTVAEAGDGEVILEAAVTEEFSGTVLPAGWLSGDWSGGTTTVGGGALAVDGTHAYTTAAFGPGSVLEFVATFRSEDFQNVGFSAGSDFNAPWVVIGRGNAAGTGVYARDDANTTVLLSGAVLGAPHRFRIDWRPYGAFHFYVDGALLDTTLYTRTLTTPMVVQVSDFNTTLTALDVDWLRVTPHAALGSYLSRVYDALGTADWGVAEWTAQTPAGTSLSLHVRTGDTPVPDGGWSAFAPVPSSGSEVGATSRYIQYRADLATGDSRVTPVLEDVALSCTSQPDATAPLITAVTATPAADGASATVTWTTDEPATSRVDYGTSPEALTANVSAPALAVSHSLDLTGLSPNTTYHYRVTSVDAASNSATDPEPPAEPRSFTTPVVCPADRTAAEFALGTPDANLAIALEGDGEVILKPASGTEFPGSTLPADWQALGWGAGGSTTVGGGMLALDHARAATAAAFGPGRAMEFVAAFQPARFQHVGFVADMAFDSPWAIVSTGTAGDGVYARTSGGGNVPLPGSLLGSSHRYRIVWTANAFEFYVDDATTPAATLAQTVATDMLALASDLDSSPAAPTDSALLRVDWLRVTPYAASGSFVSRVHDGGEPTTWGAATWTASVPAGASLAVLARTGDTPAPDASWTAFLALSNGGMVGGNSRYLQYRADLSTGDPAVTPVLRDVAFACSPGPDLTAPTVSAIVATPALDGLSATITWNTDEPADSRVDYGTSAAALGSWVTDAARVRAHALLLAGLTPGATYHFRVTSADPAANTTTEPAPPATLTFTTPAPPCLTDVTAADFALGTPTGTYVSSIADGEVLLAPTVGSEFPGTTLPEGWTSGTYGAGGTVTVGGGMLSVSGAYAGSSATYGPGRSVEFVATFDAAANGQHAGFGVTLNENPWAIFSTAAGGVLQARTLTDGGSATNTTLAVGWLGAPHRFQIDWKADTVVFRIDGQRVATHVVAILGPMRAIVSRGPVGTPLVADWLRLTPYASSGTFLSRVYDAGGTVGWSAATWNADLPAGTSLAMSARRGDTPAPDGTWTAFVALASSGATVGGTSRYLQYRAELATTDPAVTPALRDASIACVACGTAPEAVAGLAVARATPAAPGGVFPLRVTFTPPASGDVEVYRAPFGGYPSYDDAGGAGPPSPSYPPAPPWALTGVAASGQTDTPPARDVWHYVAFARDLCGQVSAPSAVALAPDYLLGDVVDGYTDCVGDGQVSTADVSLLGDHYGSDVGPDSTFACLDVGPTSDYSVNGRPLTDGRLQVEDFVMFGLNYGAATVPQAAVRAAAEGPDVLVLEAPPVVTAGERIVAELRMSGTGRVIGLSARLAWDANLVRPVAMRSGGWLESQGGLALTPAPGTVDAVVIGGRGAGLTGEGALASVEFEALASGAPAIVLAGVDARDASNHPIEVRLAAAPPAAPMVHETRLGSAAPNPFRDRTRLAFALAARGPVDLAIHSVDGRRVRTLARGIFEAGEHAVTWEGTDDHGAPVRPGLYFARLDVAGARWTRTLVRIR
jgi:hypothetical protein